MFAGVRDLAAHCNQACKIKPTRSVPKQACLCVLQAWAKVAAGFCLCEGGLPHYALFEKEVKGRAPPIGHPSLTGPTSEASHPYTTQPTLLLLTSTLLKFSPCSGVDNVEDKGLRTNSVRKKPSRQAASQAGLTQSRRLEQQPPSPGPEQ